MTKKHFIKFVGFLLILVLILSAGGCSLNAYSVEELRAFILRQLKIHSVRNYIIGKKLLMLLTILLGEPVMFMRKLIKSMKLSVMKTENLPI